MDTLDLARRALIPAFALAVLSAGCGHLPVSIVSSDPLSAEEHARLGASYEAQGLKKEAAAQYDLALGLDADYEPALMASGDAAFEAGDLKKAERRFRRVLKSSPHHAAANNNLAMIDVARNKRLDEAERRAKDALAQNGPLKPFILDTLANVYLKEKRYAEASAALDDAQLAAPPDNAAVKEHLLATRALIDAAAPAAAMPPSNPPE